MSMNRTCAISSSISFLISTSIQEQPKLLEFYSLLPPQVSRKRRVPMPAPAMLACSFRSDLFQFAKPRQQFVSRWKVPGHSSGLQSDRKRRRIECTAANPTIAIWLQSPRLAVRPCRRARATRDKPPKFAPTVMDTRSRRRFGDRFRGILRPRSARGAC